MTKTAGAIDLSKYPKYLQDRFLDTLLEGAKKYYDDPANRARYEQWLANGWPEQYKPYMTDEQRKAYGL